MCSRFFKVIHNFSPKLQKRYKISGAKNVNSMPVMSVFTAYLFAQTCHLPQCQICYVNPNPLLYKDSFIWQEKLKSIALTVIQLVTLQKTKEKEDVKHHKDIKREMTKRVSTVKYNQEHLCDNSLTPLSRQIQSPEEVGE